MPASEGLPSALGIEGEEARQLFGNCRASSTISGFVLGSFEINQDREPPC